MKKGTENVKFIFEITKKISTPGCQWTTWGKFTCKVKTFNFSIFLFLLNFTKFQTPP